MNTEKKTWYQQWFNEDYAKLYAYRGREEAKHQVEFLIKALSLTGKEKVLDLGCGSGRHSFQLAERGCDVVGIDLSDYLIGEALNALKDYPHLRIRFLAEDMFEAERLGVFDVVVNMFTSFGYFQDDWQNERFFDVVRSCLKPGGQFFLDYLHPSQVKKNLVVSSNTQIADEMVEIQKCINKDFVVKQIRFPSPPRVYEERVKLYSRLQIEEMLARNNLQVIHVWNDYAGNPWKEKGERQLFHCIAV